MTFDELLAAFGGIEGLMAVTGARRNAVNHWRSTGVPYRHWPAIRAAARLWRIKGVDDEALMATRPMCAKAKSRAA